MSTQKTLENICLDPENPLAGKSKDLEKLKYHKLEGVMDARFYARNLWEIYGQTVSQDQNYTRSKSRAKKREIAKTLQQVLNNGNVHIVPRNGMVVLKAGKRSYGFHLDNSSMKMRDVGSIPIPFGNHYWLRGKTYHVDKIVQYPASGKVR